MCIGQGQRVLMDGLESTAATARRPLELILHQHNPSPGPRPRPRPKAGANCPLGLCVRHCGRPRQPDQNRAQKASGCFVIDGREGDQTFRRRGRCAAQQRGPRPTRPGRRAGPPPTQRACWRCGTRGAIEKFQTLAGCVTTNRAVCFALSLFKEKIEIGVTAGPAQTPLRRCPPACEASQAIADHAAIIPDR